MKVVICEKAPKGHPFLLAKLPETCPFCGRPTSEHEVSDTKRDKEPS